MNIQEKIKNNVSIDENGCWNWLMCKSVRGYGKLKYGDKHWRTHRLSYTVFVGEIPEDIRVLHKCDNPSCVNPEHLFLGTDFDNMRDMVTKGRTDHLIGERNGYAKLTEKDVKEIKIMLSKNLSYPYIAKKFNVTAANIYCINRGKSWKNVHI